MEENEEKPSDLFVRTFWDAAAVIVYALGVVAVHYIIHLIDEKDLPAVAVVTLFALEYGFLLVAVGAFIRAAIVVIRNAKALSREIAWDKLRAALRGDVMDPPGSRIRRIVVIALKVVLAIFICVAVVIGFANSLHLFGVILAFLGLLAVNFGIIARTRTVARILFITAAGSAVVSVAKVGSEDVVVQTLVNVLYAH